MAVVEVEGVIPTLAMDVEHTVIVLWVEVEVILLVVPPVACEYRCYYCKNRCTRGHKAGHKHHTCHEHRTCRH